MASNIIVFLTDNQNLTIEKQIELLNKKNLYTRTFCANAYKMALTGQDIGIILKSKEEALSNGETDLIVYNNISQNQKSVLFNNSTSIIEICKKIYNITLTNINSELIPVTDSNTSDIYDFVIVGGGPGGIISAYKISQNNPSAKILLLEKYESTLQDYKDQGYNSTTNWFSAMTQSSFHRAYQSNDNKTIWLGRGLGGGTLHFGLQYIDNIDKNYEEWTNNNYFNDLSNITNAQRYDYNGTVSEGWNTIKAILDNSASNSNFTVYNNKVYSTDLNNYDRLLLGNLIIDNPNINIQYNVSIKDIIFNNSNVNYIRDYLNNRYYCNNLILSAGAIETPAILQRSNIDCGNKIYDHLAINITYGKIEATTTTTTTTTTQPFSGTPEFLLNTTNIGKLNQYSGRNIYYATGSGVSSSDINKVYDFTSWVNSHPGGSSAITKADSQNWELKYPHSSSRWTSYRGNFIELDGKKFNETINYNDLPSNLKSDTLYNDLFPDEEVTETTTETTYGLAENINLNQNTIVNHLQTRDNSFNWQTYYSGIPGQDSIFNITYASSCDLNNDGFVKINNISNDLLDISLNHLGGSYKEKIINYILDAFNKNDNILAASGYQRIAPDSTVAIDSSYIESISDSIYHYHGTCAIGDVVDENLKVYNYNNLYIADNSVLDKPWGGSTSVPAAITGLIVSENFINN